MSSKKYFALKTVEIKKNYQKVNDPSSKVQSYGYLK